MTIGTHVLVGYDPTTDLVATEFPIPDEKLSFVLRTVEPDEDDPGAIESYAVTFDQVKDILGVLGGSSADRRLDYFLQCFAPA